jgi:allantoin racemase
MARANILVVNPNSNPAVTAGLDAALGTLRLADGPSIRCTTLAEGPFGIETQKDVEQVTLPLRRLVEQDNAADAFVIACFSDPGLQLCREATRRPVFGINECGVLTALARGDRFGIIAIAAKSVARHQRYLRQMGLVDRATAPSPAWRRSAANWWKRTARTSSSWVAPAWRAIATRSKRRLACR